jgi:hypothetical protein
MMEFCTYVGNYIVPAVGLSLYIADFKRKLLVQIFPNFIFFCGKYGGVQ